MKMRPIDVLNNLKGHVLWPQSYHLSEAEAKVCIKALEQEPICPSYGVDCADCPAYKPQEPKIGHWSHDGSRWKNRFICSRCGYKLFDEPTNYCPNCGANMVEPQERSGEK